MMEKNKIELLKKERMKRIDDAAKLKKPDRVPFVPMFSFFPAKYAGMTCKDYMHDYDNLRDATKKAILEYEPDQYLNPYGLFGLGPLMGILDFNQVKRPGYGVPVDHSFQVVEKEYMTADEYDVYLFDPTDFMLRFYLPRICGTLDGLKKLPYLPGQYYLRVPKSAAMLGLPEITSALQALLEAGAEGQRWAAKAGAFGKEMDEFGFPHMFGATAYAPFDYFGDNFRGTRGIMLDMYRHPEKLLMALEKALPVLARSAIADAKNSGIPYIFMPLHKGLDGFMSPDQFKTFYWPTLRELMMEFINHDLVPCPIWEGKCDSRLEIIKDIPAGKAIYHFEGTDLFKAKEVLRDRVCIRGNVPASMLIMETPEMVEEYCKKLIDVVGKDGGFIMDGAVGIPDEAKPENVKIMETTTKEYGVYN